MVRYSSFFEFVKERLFICGIAFFLLGIAFMAKGVSQKLAMKSAATDLYSLDWENLKWHQHVVADIDLAFSSGLADGKKDRMRYFYFVPQLGETQEGYYYFDKILVFEIFRNDSAEMDKVSNASTLIWYENDASEFGYYSQKTDGFLRKMNKTEKRSFQSVLRRSGFSDMEIDNMLIPYVLTDEKTTGTELWIMFGIIGLIAGPILFAIWFFIHMKEKEKEEAQTFTKIGVVNDIYDPYSSNQDMF